MNKKPTVIVIAGPTASGKSSVGVLLAQKLNTQVISADSMQIYKGLDVGTAKIKEEESQGVKHFLIDICDITESFSVAEYKEKCYEKIEEITQAGKVPIIVGGTGLYINAIVNNMNFNNKESSKVEEVEEEIEQLKKEYSNIYNYLKEIDEKAALKIDPNNTRRIERAIKMYLLGTKKSEVDERKDLWIPNESKYDFFVIYIDIPRSLLYDRINQRVDEMIEKGILNEAKGLFEREEHTSKTVFQAIGYKEFFPYFEGTMNLEECAKLLKQKTRNYAKRQVTWFNKLKNKFEVDGTNTKEEIVSNIIKEYYEKEDKKNRV